MTISGERYRCGCPGVVTFAIGEPGICGFCGDSLVALDSEEPQPQRTPFRPGRLRTKLRVSPEAMREAPYKKRLARAMVELDLRPGLWVGDNR